MSNTHEQIMTEIQAYSEENGKFTEKGVKASAILKLMMIIMIKIFFFAIF